ncbi:hypothetical protein Y1Q_0010166 [Alligator mississippiensis]|uniref:Uncharacterized protein n=1 Tax=Alligator mississippiensis TaxID=8496 RepID=A0A151NG08_ALLMI|nr:hypothetical protein Y1Q_0010166 [Alligator mississippiensis]
MSGAICGESPPVRHRTVTGAPYCYSFPGAPMNQRRWEVGTHVDEERPHCKRLSHSADQELTFPDSYQPSPGAHSCSRHFCWLKKGLSIFGAKNPFQTKGAA